jgi:peptide/nickel transport system ATP-binding protein
MTSVPAPAAPVKRPGEAPVLEVAGLEVSFPSESGRVHAVRGLDYAVGPGEVLGIVGESGSGKSVSSLAVMGLLPEQARVSGSIRFRGRELIGLSDPELAKIRGRRVAMIFQDPLSALTPVYSVGDQIAEVVRRHEGVGRRAARDRAVEMLRLVHIPNAERRMRDYPHQFSGGMRQRVMIAMALACNPALLIADEPTTALDVTIQAQILDLLAEMKSRLGMSIMLITHAMGLVAETAQRVVVMYAGRVVEEAPVRELFAHPRHPYTQGLIRSIPRIDTAALRKPRLDSIPGVVPSPLDPLPGCRFAPRCAFARAACREAVPRLREIAPGHSVACVLP